MIKQYECRLYEQTSEQMTIVLNAGKGSIDNALMIKQYEGRFCEKTSEQMTIVRNGGKGSIDNALMINNMRVDSVSRQVSK